MTYRSLDTASQAKSRRVSYDYSVSSQDDMDTGLTIQPKSPTAQELSEASYKRMYMQALSHVKHIQLQNTKLRTLLSTCSSSREAMLAGNLEVLQKAVREKDHEIVSMRRNIADLQTRMENLIVEQNAEREELQNRVLKANKACDTSAQAVSRLFGPSRLGGGMSYRKAISAVFVSQYVGRQAKDIEKLYGSSDCAFDNLVHSAIRFFPENWIKERIQNTRRGLNPLELLYASVVESDTVEAFSAVLKAVGDYLQTPTKSNISTNQMIIQHDNLKLLVKSFILLFDSKKHAPVQYLVDLASSQPVNEPLIIPSRAPLTY
ncbi:ORF92-like protein [Bufonid herpesvirus 1]|uniref:ORF92-like protein n=1 Tax=Bufonid herpesvirus 1 TaxID=2282206 RepID=UPI000EB6E0F7|nr:ORF92-like protein [Bufonid herpesvirus 1]AXF48536.1 ORF92-like protein [Bufonid herpesvirus 1]